MANVRDFLEQRETEVATALEKLRREAEPLEAELADIRRAKSALGLPQRMTLGEVVSQLAINVENWTLKQLALKALADHFPQGATANQLLDFFESGYGRRIERSSLSPQLSRLKEEGLIELDGKLWQLTSRLNEPPTPEGGGSITGGA